LGRRADSVRDLFRQARRNTLYLVFIDEIRALASIAVARARLDRILNGGIPMSDLNSIGVAALRQMRARAVADPRADVTHPLLPDQSLSDTFAALAGPIMPSFTPALLMHMKAQRPKHCIICGYRCGAYVLYGGLINRCSINVNAGLSVINSSNWRTRPAKREIGMFCANLFQSARRGVRTVYR